MALTKCPECGEKISSIAEQCVHCGCKISACPDCGEIFAGEINCCSSCGFNFKKARKKESGKNFKGILDYWGACAPGDKLLSKLIPLLFAVIGVGFITFLIIATTNVLRLGYNEDNTKIFSLGVSVTTSVIFSVIFFVLLITSNILHSAFIPCKCGAWIRDGEIDITDFTAQLRRLPRSKRTSKNNKEIRSAYASEYPGEVSRIIKIGAICGVIYIVCFIIACMFLTEGINDFIVKTAFHTPIINPETGADISTPATLLNTLDWALFLIPVGIIVVTLAVDILFRVSLKKKIADWLGAPEKPSVTASPAAGEDKAVNEAKPFEEKAFEEKSVEEKTVEEKPMKENAPEEKADTELCDEKTDAAPETNEETVEEAEESITPTEEEAFTESKETDSEEEILEENDKKDTE